MSSLVPFIVALVCQIHFTVVITRETLGEEEKESENGLSGSVHAKMMAK